MKNAVRYCRLIMAIACLASVSACTHVPWRTAWAMKDVDLVSVDPRVIRIAFGLPEGAGLDSVSLEMKFIRQGTVVIDSKFDLDVITSGPELSQPGLPWPMDNQVVLRVPESRIAELMRFQGYLLSERADPKGAQVSFGVGSKMNSAWIETNCDAGADGIEISAWILVDQQQGYLPLLKDSSLGKLLDDQSRGICAQTG